MKNMKKLLLLTAILVVSASNAVTKKVGDGPIFLTINNKTDKGYVMDRPFALINLESGKEGKPLALIKPRESITLSGIEWNGHSRELAFDIMPLGTADTNSSAQIELILETENIDSSTFNAILHVPGKRQKEIATVTVPRLHLKATSFVIHVTLDGENLEKSDIDLSSGTSAVGQ